MCLRGSQCGKPGGVATFHIPGKKINTATLWPGKFSEGAMKLGSSIF